MAHGAGSPRRLIPPVYFLVALALMGFFHAVTPVARILVEPYRYAGLVIAALALGIAVWAALELRRAGTPLHPFDEPRALVTTGPYEHTRNPIYLAMAGVLLGAALYMGSITPFLVIPAFVAVITDRFIRDEETRLRASFGAEYDAYQARVRRWL
jgi:protein-S-isoprenylcysteine O-methyltransferase Ste14